MKNKLLIEQIKNQGKNIHTGVLNKLSVDDLKYILQADTDFINQNMPSIEKQNKIVRQNNVESIKEILSLVGFSASAIVGVGLGANFFVKGSNSSGVMATLAAACGLGGVLCVARDFSNYRKAIKKESSGFVDKLKGNLTAKVETEKEI